MIDVEVKRSSANLAALDEQMRQAFDMLFSGLSTGGGVVKAHFIDGVSETIQAAARDMIANHDAARLTPGQERELQDHQKLDKARREYAEIALNPDDYKAEAIKNLYLKVLWLESEVRRLTGNPSSQPAAASPQHAPEPPRGTRATKK